MSWFGKDKPEREKERFYLLPGMGGRAYRRKQKVILQYTILAGLAISACFALVLCWMSRPHK